MIMYVSVYGCVCCIQVVQELNQFSTLHKLGSAYGAKSTQHVTEAEGLARRQARHRQEQRFMQQAAVPSQLSPSHLY